MAEYFPAATTILDSSCARSSCVRSDTQLEEEVVSLFDEFRTPLLRYLRGNGLGAEDAEEIVQEVFLALFQHLRAGKARHNLRGWLFRVAHNLGLKRRASRGRHGGVDGCMVADPSLNPEDQFACAEHQGRLLSVVKALSEQDRACLHLRAEGLRYREIAEVVGISLSAVSISLTRSMAKLSRASER
jgi:RNA polymerase sigma-70 factor (ECF subfamily)